MPNYGFNENEIVATKTVQIDKDGFHRIVEGTDGGSSTPSGLKDFNATVICDPENVNIDIRMLVRVGSDAYDTLSVASDSVNVGFAVDPLNSIDPSTLPKTMSQEDMMEFANAHTFLSPEDMIIDPPENDPALWIGDGSYASLSMSIPDPETPSGRMDYTLPVGDLQSQGKIAQINDDTNASYHYEFDLTILVASNVDGTENRNIFADTVHVVTPEYGR